MQRIKPRRPLYIGQSFRRGVLQPVVYLATGQRPLELTDELLQVVLDYTVEGYQVEINVVQDCSRS